MNLVKTFSRRSLWWLLFFMLLLLTIVDLSVYFSAGYVLGSIPLDKIRAAAAQMPELRAGIDRAIPVIHQARTLFIPVSFILFLFFGILQWIAVRGVFARTLGKAGITEPAAKGKLEKRRSRVAEDEEGVIDKKALLEQNQRYYLHIVAVLQREGRLIDFLKEDLTPYDDTQIGAAVRSIHENCRKTLDRYLSPKAVMEKNEGEQITVPKDFDPGVIKLIGNVTGEPPFTGVLRHRGWRAAKLDLPVLSGSGESRIIAPAEVEIP